MGSASAKHAASSTSPTNSRCVPTSITCSTRTENRATPWEVT